MRRRSFILVRGLTIAALVSFSGCASPAQPSSAPSSPRSFVIGKIVIVNEEQHFVLIDLESSLYVPENGATLRARNGTMQTANLKASLEQKRPFIAADIVDGHPAMGDEVVR